LTWAILGPGSVFSVQIDGRVVETVTKNSGINITALAIDLKTLTEGLHTVTVTVIDGVSSFPLSRGGLDGQEPLSGKPAADQAEFNVA